MSITHSWERPEMPVPHGAVPLLQDYLVHSAHRLPDKVALVCAGQRLTYGEIEARSNALAQHLVAAGVSRGDRVMIFADNGVETVLSFWAALKANAVACIVSPLVRSERLDYLLRDSRPAALIADGKLYPAFGGPARACPSLRTLVVCGPVDDARLAELPNAVRWDEALASGDGEPPARRCIESDLAAIVYTSGSTGDPKGVMLTHRNMMAACASVASYLELAEDEVILNVLPMAFSYGLYQMITAFYAGARLVLERSFAFPTQVLEVLVSERATGFPGVPTVFSALAEMKSLGNYDLSSLRYITNAGAALPLRHVQFLRDLLPQARLFSMYGLTECKRCSYLPPEDLDRKPLSVGIPIPNTEFWIVDEAGNRVGPDVVGQLVVRGPTIMKGYWEKPEATAKVLRPGPWPGEQVLYTGDYGRIDADGYLYFVGRMDDIIKSRGEKVVPREVENALVNVPGVKEAAVIGVPDEMLGHAVKAFVVLEQGIILNEKELQRECHRRLESFMVPKHIAIVPGLPRTDSGKIKKTSLV
jgi:amino acid adenylation domain-containing protein